MPAAPASNSQNEFSEHASSYS